MRYGVTLPYEEEPQEIVELAMLAEESGWDGVFVWDGITGNDAWITLAAIAARTKRVTIGPMLTPLSRRRPWKVALEAATLDRLAGGRLVLPVGLGAPDTGFAKFGEATDRRERAEMLDEGLDILDGLWSGEPFSYAGMHYQIADATFTPLPLQRPRVPIWVVGAWPRPKSMRRAVRCDGLLPTRTDGELTPDDVRAAVAFVRERRGSLADYQVIMEGDTPGDDVEQASAQLRPWVEVGLTWWLENVWNLPRERAGTEGMRQRISQGPPRIR